jgi:hypothetical protein
LGKGEREKYTFNLENWSSEKGDLLILIEGIDEVSQPKMQIISHSVDEEIWPDSLKEGDYLDFKGFVYTRSVFHKNLEDLNCSLIKI